MACNNLVTISNASCSNNSGGIVEIYINDQDNVTGLTVNPTAWTVTGISVTSPYTQFEFKRNVGSVVSTPTIDLIAGSSFYTNTVTLKFHRREASKSRALNILAEGQRYLSMIVKDANGSYWYIDYAQLNGGDETTGVTRAEGSAYDVTFLAESDHRIYEVDPSIIAGLI